MKWNLKKLKVSQLIEWDKNPRQLTEKGLSDLRKSIERFGIAEPIICNTDYVICGGHGRLKILQQLNIKEVDCYLPEKKLTTKQFEELNIRLNKNIAGEFDFDLLANNFELPDLLEYGFNERELSISVEEINRLEEWNKNNMPEFEAGDKEIKLIIIFASENHRENWCKENSIDKTSSQGLAWTLRL